MAKNRSRSVSTRMTSCDGWAARITKCDLVHEFPIGTTIADQQTTMRLVTNRVGELVAETEPLLIIRRATGGKCRKEVMMTLTFRLSIHAEHKV